MINQKIVHVMLAGPVTDGWNYQDNMLTKYHKRMGYEVSMITSQWVWGTDGKLKKDTRDRYLNEHEVFVRRLALKGKDDFNKKLKGYVGLKEALEEEQPDILFIHGVQHWNMPVLVKFIKTHKDLKVFADNHTDFSNSATNWLSKNILHGILWKHMAHMIAPYTEKFYGVLPARVDFLVDMYGLPKDKCELLVMGGDDEAIAEASVPEQIKAIRTQYGIGENDFLIMTGGKIDEAKKQTLLLMEAVKEINRPDVKLIVFGSVEDSLKETVDTLADGKRIQYIGWINAADSYKYFAAADLVVFPGRHSVFWEQVASQGVPMFCKYWEGTTHVNVCDNVKFLKEDSCQEMTGMIQYLLDSAKEYSTMKKNSDKASVSFRYSRIAKQSIQE